MGIEIINGAFDVYMASVGETYTDLSQTPAGNWAKIGSSGKRHYGEDGVVISLTQENENHAFAGGTEILKVSRTLEEMSVSFTLYDLTSAEIIKAFNLGTTTTDTASGSSVGGSQSFNLLRGLSMTSKALLIRGEDKSSDLSTENIQIEIPACVQVGSLELVFNKSENVGVKFDLKAIADYTYNSGNSPYGRMFIGDAAAS